MFGISDSIFAIGDNAVAPIARRFYSMPMLLLAAKLCPPGMEATLFASIMVSMRTASTVWQTTIVIAIGLLDFRAADLCHFEQALSNFGGDVGSYFGIVLQRFFDVFVHFVCTVHRWQSCRRVHL